MLGDAVVAVYAGGSWALDAYDAGRSDLDVAAIVARPVRAPEKRSVLEAVRHETLPCPARGLELVVYRADVVASGSADPDYELDINTGPRMPFRCTYASSAADPGDHWYAIDRAIYHAHGVSLFGPPVETVFAPIRRRDLLDRLIESIEWHRHGGPRPDDAVLNSCRALRFAREGVWCSKRAAGRWAIDNGFDRDLIVAALSARDGGEPPDRVDVDRFLAEAAAAVRESAG